MSAAPQPIGVIAKLLDLSERRVQQLAREGVIPKETRGQYDLVGSVQGYVRYLRDQAEKARGGAPDYAAERARFIRARADLAELDAEARRGRLLEAADVEAAWTAVLALLRTRLLALPDGLAPQLHAAGSVGDTRAALRMALRGILEELAETDVEIDTPNPDAPEPAGRDSGSERDAAPGARDAQPAA